MFCSKCGNSEGPSSRYCSKCGNALAVAEVVSDDAPVDIDAVTYTNGTETNRVAIEDDVVRPSNPPGESSTVGRRVAGISLFVLSAFVGLFTLSLFGSITGRLIPFILIGFAVAAALGWVGFLLVSGKRTFDKNPDSRKSIPPLRPDWPAIREFAGGTWKETFRGHGSGGLRAEVSRLSRCVGDQQSTGYPWIYSRFMLYSLAGFLVGLLILESVGPSSLLPLAVFLAAAAAPLTVVIFLWECAPSCRVSLVRLLAALVMGGVIGTLARGLLATSGALAWDSSRILSVTVTYSVLVALTVLVSRGLPTTRLLDGAVLGAATGAGYIMVDRFWLWLGWGNEFFNLEFLLNIVVRYWWVSFVSAPLWIGIAASGLWLASRTEGRVRWAAVWSLAFLAPFFAGVVLAAFNEEVSVLNITNYPAAVAQWILVMIVGFYALLTYVVAGRDEERSAQELPKLTDSNS